MVVGGPHVSSGGRAVTMLEREIGMVEVGRQQIGVWGIFSIADYQNGA